MNIRVQTVYALTEKPLITENQDGSVTLHDTDFTGPGGFSIQFPGREPWTLEVAHELVAALERSMGGKETATSVIRADTEKYRGAYPMPR
jgi:hypothetical protein